MDDNEIGEVIVNSARECVEENTSVLEAAVLDAGRRAVSLLRQRSAKRTGRYRRGWCADVDTDETGTSCTVHDRRYQLTHLLERGHRITNQTRRDLGRVPGDSVIDGVYREVAERFAEAGEGT